MDVEVAGTLLTLKSLVDLENAGSSGAVSVVAGTSAKPYLRTRGVLGSGGVRSLLLGEDAVLRTLPTGTRRGGGARRRPWSPSDRRTA
jgi:hypothetical protein